MVVLQRVQTAAEAVVVFLAAEDFLGIGSPVLDLGQNVDPDFLAASMLAHPVDGGIARNRAEPGDRARAVRRVAARPMPDLQENIVQHVLGMFAVAYNRQDDAEQLGRGEIVYPRQCRPITVRHTGDSRGQFGAKSIGRDESLPFPSSYVIEITKGSIS